MDLSWSVETHQINMSVVHYVTYLRCKVRVTFSADLNHRSRHREHLTGKWSHRPGACIVGVAPAVAREWDGNDAGVEASDWNTTPYDELTIIDVAPSSQSQFKNIETLADSHKTIPGTGIWLKP